MAYAFGYTFGINTEMVYEDLLALGDMVNAYGLEVVERKLNKPKIVHKLFKGKYVKFSGKIKFSDGNVIPFKFFYPFSTDFRLVQVDPQDQAMMQGGNMEELQKQLEALGLGNVSAGKENKAKKPIGFVTE